jgi:hypothetical protein
MVKYLKRRFHGFARTPGVSTTASLRWSIGPTIYSMKNIRVTTNRTIDFHSLKSIAAGIIKPGMGGEQKALACYEVVRHYMFHYPWVYNERPRREEWHDAVKLLRTYGHGLCGVQARVLGALYQEVFGFENQRLTGAIEKEVAIGPWASYAAPSTLACRSAPIS